MVNWTTNVSSIKVLSRDRVEDRNPDLYVQRGEKFKEAGKYKEAEQEYAKAYQFSAKDDTYLLPLINLYYATKDKKIVRKAEKIHYGLYWRQQKFAISVMLCVLCGCMVHASMVGMFVTSLLFICAFAFMASFFNPIEMSKAVEQNKFGRHILRIPIGIALCCILPVSAIEFGAIPEIPIEISRLLAIPLAVGCVFFLVQAIKSFGAGITKLVNRIKK